MPRKQERVAQTSCNNLEEISKTRCGFFSAGVSSVKYFSSCSQVFSAEGPETEFPREVVNPFPCLCGAAQLKQEIPICNRVGNLRCRAFLSAAPLRPEANGWRKVWLDDFIGHWTRVGPIKHLLSLVAVACFLLVGNVVEAETPDTAYVLGLC